MSKRPLSAPKKTRRLVGRTIVKAAPHGCWEGEGKNRRFMHDWTLTLDDGTAVLFFVEEHPDGGEYGVDIILAGTKKKP